MELGKKRKLSSGLGDIWCQAGGEYRQYAPMQCAEQTTECWKYICDDIDGLWHENIHSFSSGTIT